MPAPLAEAFVRIRANTTGFKAEARKGIDGAGLGKAGEVEGGKFSAGFAKAMKAGLVAGGGIALAFGAAIKQAGDFQQKMSVLVTAAGESAKGLEVVKTGVLDLAVSTGTAIRQLEDGAYQVEKAGFRGAAALGVLKAAAQGAREEGASLASVTQALTSVMASYHLNTGTAAQVTRNATQVMNEMKTAAGESKTTMEEFAASLSTVLPLASQSGISFAQVGGALGTLTQHGTTAAEATLELGFLIRNLANPLKPARAEIEQLGLSSIDVAKSLGKRGLTGTVSLLVEAITKHMGPAGLVLLDTFNKSTSAAQSAQAMFKALPAAGKQVATAFMAGQLTAKQFTGAVRALPAPLASLVQQWASAERQSKGFSGALRSGSTSSQTFLAALRKVTGGATGMNAALQLSGENMPGFKDRVDKIAESARNTGKDIQGWATIQHNFNFKLDQMRGIAEKLGITLGTKLLPPLTSALGFMARHITLTEGLVFALGGLAGSFAAVAVATKAWMLVTGAAGLAVKAITLVTKAWTVAQAALNFVLSANPIGLVIVGLAALAAGLIYAYRNSTTFRNIVNGAFHAVAEAAKFMWNDVLKPVFRFLVDNWFAVAGAIVHGAATAFGWVPGVGPKLRGAAKQFDQFRNDVNRSLGGIVDQKVDVKAVISAANKAAGIALSQTGAARVHFDEGGRVPGMPVYGRDNMVVPIDGGASGFAGLASGEFVMPTHMTDRYLPWLESMRQGTFAGYAGGGVVVRPVLPSHRDVDRVAAEAGGTFGRLATELLTIAKVGQAAVQSAQAAVSGNAGAALSNLPPGAGFRVGTSTFGGPNDPGTGSIGYHGDNLNGRSAYAELDMGHALGTLPYRTKARITYGGRSIIAEKLDIGLGGGPFGGVHRGLDLWWQTARALGFPEPGGGVTLFQRLASGGVAGGPDLGTNNWLAPFYAAVVHEDHMKHLAHLQVRARQHARHVHHVAHLRHLRHVGGDNLGVSARTLFGYMSHGGKPMEDLSFRGMPKSYRYGALADAFYGSHSGIDYGPASFFTVLKHWLTTHKFAAGGIVPRGVVSRDYGGPVPNGWAGLNTSGRTEWMGFPAATRSTGTSAARLHPDDIATLADRIGQHVGHQVERRPVVLQIDGQTLDYRMGRMVDRYGRGV